MVRRAYDGSELARIQPVEVAPGTIVDHYIAGTAVIMRVHIVMALRAPNVALQFAAVRRLRNNLPTAPPRPKLCDEGRENAHRDEGAVALSAVENAVLGHGRVHQRDRADGAAKRGRATENANPFIVLFRRIHLMAVG